MTLIDNLEWRYATKKFDPTKKISNSDLEQLKTAVQLSASSYGLQLYKVLIIDDEKTRSLLRPASWNQSQIIDASHLFVFCNYSDVLPEDIDAFVDLKAMTYGKNSEDLKGYGDFIKKKMNDRTLTEKANWTSRQVYIAVGNLLAAAAELKIDTCPMEGFDPGQYDEILNLREKGLSAAVVVTAGYRLEEDQSQYAPKVRKTIADLFETI